ncbi:hypothetical protein FQR65_LT02321 [Abscondita terminalis]|nr:hypothetical protein FQR65_LT02321 [Abscondita terminalis]
MWAAVLLKLSAFICLEISTYLDISPNGYNVLIGRNAESGHNVEKQKLKLYGSEIGRPSLKRGQTVLQKQIKTDGHNAETWTQRQN